jgi:SAP domain-containing ribonucleoprotein
VADLKEICSRANISTTTRSTKADLITKILASQPAKDAYNAKYQQNESAAFLSKPAPLSGRDNIVSGIASKSRVALIARL